MTKSITVSVVGVRKPGVSLIACLTLVALVSAAVSAEPPATARQNLAPRAMISASSVYSSDYEARFVADGQIPEAQQHKDVGKAWCAQGNAHPNGVTLTFSWPEKEKIAELVYYGRTAWQWVENWKDYELYVKGSMKPLVRGQLKRGHGPQRIRLPESVTASSITLKFLSSYGGSNPGASEIQIYGSPLPDKALAALVPPPKQAASGKRQGTAWPASPVRESQELRGQLRSGAIGFTKLVVVQRKAISPTHVYTYHTEGQKAGGGLYVIDVTTDPPQRKQLIDASDGLVLDADLSYDGSTVLFSWKKTLGDKLQLFTIGTDGHGLKQLTRHDSNNLNACWLPDGGIAFLSDRKPAFAYCWTSSTPILYRCDRDGGEVKRLSANYLNDFTPAVMDDGQIIYSRWEYVDRPAIPIQSLWCINPDGTGLSGFFGNRVLSPATFMEAHQIPGSDAVLCVLTSHNGPCRGAIGAIDPSQGANAQEAITNLTPEIAVGRVDQGNGNNIRGPYESPFPVDERWFLVSRAGTILLRDYAGTQQVTILEADGADGYYSARPVMERRRPPVRSSNLASTDDAWATVLVQDVYRGLEPYVERGEISRIAVVQELEKSRLADVQHRAFGFQFPVVSCGATYAPKKVWGFADVEADGSAHFKVPPRLPIYFMVLDHQGRAVQRMRSFTHMMPGEHQSCIGCHADRNTVSPRVVRRPLAALRPAQDLEKPEWGVRGFSYADIVQPVLDQYCVSCHNAAEPAGHVDLSGDRTDFFNVSYEFLARQGEPGKNPYTKWIPTFNGQEANILKVTPRYWGSPASKLADIVLGGHPDRAGRRRVAVDAAERQRIFTWIDLDVPYYGTSESNHYDVRGCRQLLPAGLDQVLADVAARRCATCHGGDQGIPRDPFVRITNIQNNSFLLAPLAREAGGTQRCGVAVFQSTADPDYQAILKSFDSVQQLLEKTPRKDMCPVAVNANVQPE